MPEYKMTEEQTIEFIKRTGQGFGWKQAQDLIKHAFRNNDGRLIYMTLHGGIDGHATYEFPCHEIPMLADIDIVQGYIAEVSFRVKP